MEAKEPKMAWYTPLFQEVGEEVDTLPSSKAMPCVDAVFTKEKYEL
jgi:hypothetical protein